MPDSLHPAPLAKPTLAEVEAFLYGEARLLDERRFEEWEELFTADGYYWVPTEPGQTDPLTRVSIFYDDRALMRRRIQRLRHPDIHVQDPPSRTVRIVGNVRADHEETEDSRTLHLHTSSLIVLEYRLGTQRSFGGLVTHALTRENGSLRIRWKKVELINADGVFGPLAIPF
ncbi:benzoate/toluate 1,2-dioxygenase beta subunit [Azospirillum agricola]|uniref:aromatic-ring-hydroxylating dioxygenase subunit beta n=1 Tax=Azospirillum agricola TaxID=1720247 RepID=UPI001AEACE9B|nr:aromatic-ring-hydroxylating dioxygenase subunit beta [Azospirillum agricola]MBP2229185.1 benzoate/toluate 1,2-dioxygenase beta subunit [Azospirillum agricola]